MQDIENFSKAVCSVIGGAIGLFIGEVDGLLYALITFISTDYITGILSAAKQKNLSSDIGFWGLIKKILIFVVVGIAHLVDVQVIGHGAVLRSTIIFFYLSNEGLSIVENFNEIGVPIPRKLTEIMTQLKDRSGEKNEIINIDKAEITNIGKSKDKDIIK